MPPSPQKPVGGGGGGQTAGELRGFELDQTQGHETIHFWRISQNAGLLTSSCLEQWLRKQRIDELFAAMDKMSAIDEPGTLSPEEMAQEIAAMRAERRTGTVQ